MALDIIAFTQDELDRAVASGCTSIAICDGHFLIPPAGGISYTAIGAVTALCVCEKRRAEKLGIRWYGFEPIFSQDKTLSDTRVTYTPPGSAASYLSGYLTSYITSYRLSSYLIGGSLAYYYTSYAGSRTSSYASSYASLYSGSYAGGFEYGSEAGEDFREECIMVNGYGLNLI